VGVPPPPAGNCEKATEKGNKGVKVLILVGQIRCYSRRCSVGLVEGWWRGRGYRGVEAGVCSLLGFVV